MTPHRHLNRPGVELIVRGMGNGGRAIVVLVTGCADGRAACGTTSGDAASSEPVQV
jgi:hypothetical protein